MELKTPLAVLLVGALLAFVVVQPASAAPIPIRAAAVLGVNLSFAPNPVSVGSQTQIQVSISGGSPPYYLWLNTSIPNCNPPSQPIQQSSATGNYPCDPTSTGNFNAHVDVADNAGDHGSASATLNVQSGGSGGTSGNGTNPFNLSGLGDIFGVILIVVVISVACLVATAAAAIVLAVLVPRRLKQIRLAIEGQPMKKPKASAKDEAPPAEPKP